MKKNDNYIRYKHQQKQFQKDEYTGGYRKVCPVCKHRKLTADREKIISVCIRCFETITECDFNSILVACKLVFGENEFAYAKEFFHSLHDHPVLVRGTIDKYLFCGYFFTEEINYSIDNYAKIFDTTSAYKLCDSDIKFDSKDKLMAYCRESRRMENKMEFFNITPFIIRNSFQLDLNLLQDDIVNAFKLYSSAGIQVVAPSQHIRVIP